MRIEEQEFRIRIRLNMSHKEAEHVSTHLVGFIQEAFEGDVDNGLLVDIPEVELL